MKNRFAVIDSKHGWIVNIVVWDGDTTKWQPPSGTYAVPLDEVDLSALPQKPTEEEE
jgi:hypothetical protein